MSHDEFGSLFDAIPATSAPTARTAAWGDDPTYDRSPGLFVGPNAPINTGVGSTMSPGWDHFDGIDEDPEAALPVAYGEQDGDDIAARLSAVMAGGAPARPTPPASDDERGRHLLAYADALARGETPSGPNPFSHIGHNKQDDELAAAAAQFLGSKQAVRAYSPTERQAIIDEGSEGVRASNLDRLDITGTHYEAIEASRVPEDEDLTFLSGDPNDF